MVRAFKFWAMATGLAVLSIVRAISIENHLMPTITDCYERLAIGERLHPDDVYKFFNYNTVAECKRVCSDERKSCKAFAFGISAKGNATCELSIDAIKETADLKPLGTLHATDFDLYIKKLDCTIVVEKNNNNHPNTDYHRPSLKPVTLGNIHSEDELHHDPLQIAPGDDEIPDRPPHATDSGHQYPLPPPSHQYPPPSSHQYPPPPTSHQYGSPPTKDGVHNVQTLVSIASGPHSVLNPVHGILVAQESNNYGGSGVLPPYKPASLNRPYDSHKTRPDRFDRPDPDYGDRPDFLDAGVGYADGGSLERPHWTADRPHLDRFDVRKPWISAGYDVDRYGDRPSRIPFRPEPNFIDGHRPVPHRYGSVIPHPNEYANLPTLQSDYLFQQSHQESFSEFYHRPSLVIEGYGNDNKNTEALPEHSHHRPNRPRKPQGYVEGDKNTDRDRPTAPSQGYDDGDRNRDPNYSYERPLRPLEDNPNDYYHSGSGAPSQSYEDEKHVKPKPGQLLSGGGLVQHSEPYGRPEGNRPDAGSRPYDDEEPLRPISRPSVGHGGPPENPCCSGYDDKKGAKPIVSHSTGQNGLQITSIITQIEDGE